LTKFEKSAIIAELISDDFEMIGEAMPLQTDAVEFNKRSLAELDDVLDEIIETNPEWMARLEQIIEANK
tara:strand:- start:223 stop:429 length:207 start_codon:yes stop_codon:yes gene_type:complete